MEEFYDAYEQQLGPFGQGSIHHLSEHDTSLADSLTSLLEYDQLSKERTAGNAFSDFNEGQVIYNVCIYCTTWLKYDYVPLPSPSLVALKVALPFPRHSSTMLAPAGWTAARRRGVQLGRTGFSSTLLRIRPGGKIRSGRRNWAGEGEGEGEMKETGLGRSAEEIGTRCVDCAFDYRSIIV